METVREFQKFMEELAPSLKKIEDQYSNQALAVEQNCLNKAAGVEKEFVQCMIKKQEVYTTAFKRLELHLQFWKNSTFLCFESSPKDLSLCKAESKVLLETYIHKCLKQI